MSSIVTGGTSINRGKLLIHIAENGHSFEFDCDENTPVVAVMRFVESVSGINANDQLLLCPEFRLQLHNTLSMYKLPSSGREVFVFNRIRLQSNSPPPPLEQVDPIDIADPQLPSPNQNPHPLDDAPDPALKALPGYERQFRYHYQFGHAIYSRSLRKYEVCERILDELKVQERALEVGRGSLDRYYKVINQNYSEFMKHFSQQQRMHSDLLENFGRDIERLRSIHLPPALQRDAHKCLLDFVKEENLHKSAENCRSSHRQFERKVSQLKEMFDALKTMVEKLNWVSLPIKNLEMRIKEHLQYINEQKIIMQSLSKDVSTVKKLVDDCLSYQLSSSIRPHDAVSALGPMYEVHDRSHLPKMQACDNLISKLFEYCKEKKNEVNIFVHNYMQNVAFATYSMKDARSQFPVFKEAMVRQDDLFADLKLVRGIGPAFRACLAEVVRRKSSMKLYMGTAGQLAEKLATIRDNEIRRREEFLKAHSSYIPRDVIALMGLYDNPNQCDVNIAPFDTNLLDIDISDLDHYAPEYLTGLPFKVERRGSFKGSCSISNDGTLSLHTEETAVYNIENYETEELLEASELAEILGTSQVEVENAKLKADLASAIAQICFLRPGVDYESLDDSKMDDMLKSAAEKTAKALQEKDEYGKHLESLLKAKQMQCVAYEKRIQELEQRLSDQYVQGQKLSTNKGADEFAHLGMVAGCSDAEFSGGGETQMPYRNNEGEDEVSSISNSLNAKLGLFVRQPEKAREGVDINMMDSSGVLNAQLDSSMVENREEPRVGDEDEKEKSLGQLGMSMTNSSTAESMPVPLNSKASGDQLLDLKVLLAEKSNQLIEVESKLKAALEEVAILSRELELSRKLLDESQMNCAHLENCLHEAREEAQTHLSAANRRASEYSALRASAVKMRGLFERLRSCISAPVAGFADSLQALAQSLANSISENDDDGSAEFQECIQVLADKVNRLSRHRDELPERYPKIEAASEQLRKELEEKKALVKTLYTKHRLEKQANKEKISFGCLEVHEIAAFVLNSAGYYEAINRNCFNYYLSAESVALFTDHLPSRPSYIVGQIVHIERQIVKPSHSPTRQENVRADQMDHLISDLGNERLSLNAGGTSNPYGLPVGCEYFVVTVAMLPDTAIRSPPAS